VRTPTSILVLCLLATASARGAADEPVRIYLPRAVKVAGESLRLGALGVVLCDDGPTDSRVCATPLGRAPWPGESIVVTRKTILSCLAGRGVPPTRVRISGAQQVTVSRDERTLSAKKLMGLAEAFLQKKPAPADKGCIYKIVRKPQDLTVPGGGQLDVTCRRSAQAAAGRLTVTVTVCREGKQLGLREVLYQRMVPVRKAVASCPIPAGTMLTEKNVEIQTSYDKRPAPVAFTPPYGQLARRQLAAGSVIRASMTAEKKPNLVIRRNQMVRLRVQGSGLLITGVGQALQEGRPGDLIKVRNVDSKRTITGLVAFDGAVEPLFKR